jgi:hypothetical protein
MGSKTTKRRGRPPEPPPVIPHKARFHPEGPRGPNRTRYSYDRAREARDRAAPWLRFRHSLGLSDTRYLASLLGVTVRSIQRWEYQGPAPRWYHAALLGLRDTWGQP